MLALPLPPFAMLTVVIILIFLLGWPFEWPAIILVFLPIFYPVIAALKYDLIWFGAVVAVTMQTAYLSPPVAMSAYYLKQVVKDWSLATIYKGMFEFMALQCVAVALVMIFPQIATAFPEYLQHQAREVPVEQIKDEAPSLEVDTVESMQQQSGAEAEEAEKAEKDKQPAPDDAKK
jgi:TRAP-type mannitol/chloroaromatic compound transport system permease large subunit